MVIITFVTYMTYHICQIQQYDNHNIYNDSTIYHVALCCPINKSKTKWCVYLMRQRACITKPQWADHTQVPEWHGSMQYLRNMLMRHCPMPYFKSIPGTSFNSLWPRDAMWPHRSVSILAQVMAWCLKHQAITWTNIDVSTKVFCGIHLREISQMLINFFCKMCLEITLLKLIPQLPGANEFILKGCRMSGDLICHFEWHHPVKNVTYNQPMTEKSFTFSQNYACCWLRTRESAGTVMTHFERCELCQIIFH